MAFNYVKDTDECATMVHECSSDQACLNTKSSYLCVPTPCPDDYDRDDLSGQCVQLCSKQPNGKCTDLANTAQTISHTVLTLNKSNLSGPILKLVNYDINRSPLPKTYFSFFERSSSETFYFETVTSKRGIIYLYAKPNVKHEKVHKIKIKGESFDDEDKLSYVTLFIVYVYFM